MQPVSVTIDVPQSRADVWEFLDVLANHERFTDHMLRDYHFEGPAKGLGAKAHATAVVAGKSDAVSIEVIEVDPPVRSTERNVGAGGRRVATGTYRLADLPGGGTRVSFEYAWERAPVTERLAAPLVRAIMRRANQRALTRLASSLPS